ncbi:MAG: CRISPR-associated endonuclease Cas2 [Acetobacteraceae bacterium]|nr:CRISPR-associated endonuclease Cas2 [Rhodovarius sp.]MDW8397849.1 CRISPR-associated endonuclease Cas2 [Acetobacteraceae bacterium]
MSRRRTWLIGYDITSPRRLRRVARLLERHAYRLQYSLFVGCWTASEFDAVWGQVAALIHPRRDDVRAWPVAENAELELWGRNWPEDIVIGGLGSVPLQRLLRAGVIEDDTKDGGG